MRERYGASASSSGLWGYTAREDVVERIVEAATRYNESNAAAKEAPRQSAVIRQLRFLADQARQLERTLLEADDFLLEELRGPNLAVAVRWRQLRELADVKSLPPWSGFEYLPDEPPGWVHRLNALAKYAGLVADNVEQDLTDSGLGPKDRGGRGNMYIERWGNPKHVLTRECWNTFDECKPGEATGTSGGPFYKFAAAVYEFATGNEAEVDGRLEYHVKRIAYLYSKLAPLERELRDVVHERAALRTFPKVHRERGPLLQRRQIRLRQEITELEEEIATGRSRKGR